MTHTGGTQLIYSWDAAPNAPYKATIEDFKASYTACTVTDIVNDLRVCLPTADSFIALAKKEFIMGVSVTAKFVKYTGRDYIEYLIQALAEGEGVLPIEKTATGVSQIFFWCPEMPDKCIPVPLQDYKKLKANNLPILQADGRSYKLSLLYGVRSLIYEGALLFIEGTEGTLSEIPLYNVCKSISPTCMFTGTYNGVETKLVLNDELLGNLLKADILHVKWVINLTEWRFTVGRCSQAAIIDFVLATYTDIDSIGDFIDNWIDDNFAAYFELANLYGGSSGPLFYATGKFYASLSEDSRLRFFTIIDDAHRDLPKLDGSSVKYDFSGMIAGVLDQSWSKFGNTFSDVFSRDFDMNALLEFGDYTDRFADMLSGLRDKVYLLWQMSSLEFLETLIEVGRLSNEAGIELTQKHKDYLNTYGSELVSLIRSRYKVGIN